MSSISLTNINTTLRLTQLETMMDLVCQKVDSISSPPLPFSTCFGGSIPSIFGCDFKFEDIIQNVLTFVLVFVTCMILLDVVKLMFCKTSRQQQPSQQIIEYTFTLDELPHTEPSTPTSTPTSTT